MNEKLFRRMVLVLTALVGVALLLIYLTWPALPWAIAMASSESRPALLNDANWGEPSPAFSERFSGGTSEGALLRWLAANRFRIDERSHEASRTVQGLPCAESIEVSWSEKDGTINKSSAVVSEAGCL